MPILCGTDLSDAGAEGLAAAAALARACRDRTLIAVHVLDADGPGGDELAARTRPRLDAAVAAVTSTELTVRAELVIGPPVATLASLAETEGAGLIVVSSKGHTNSPLYRLGGTSEKLAVASSVPVMVVRSAAPFLAWSAGERALRALVGVDDSFTCDVGVEWLQRCRGQRAIDIVLAAVYYGDEAARHYGLRPASAVEANPEVEHLIARDLIRRFGGTRGHGALTARPVRGLGKIAVHLIEQADADRADLIVVGASHATGLGRLGSVSAGVIHDAPQSVLCVPATAAARRTVPTFRAAMVATDLSEFANQAVPYAFALSPGNDREVHIVHVIGDDVRLDDAGLEELHGRLRGLAPSETLLRLHTHVVHGDEAATTLAETAARLGVDIICIASHGRSGISRAVVGSVADRLLRETRVPVLVLRPKAD